MASQQGFEPRLNGPKPLVLPLDDRELWCSVMDSNQRLPLCKSGILSTELTEHGGGEESRTLVRIIFLPTVLHAF